jgi:arylsulfatase
VKIGDRTYKNHLDGYNQLDLLLGKEPSKRREIFYFGGAKVGAIRIDDMKFRFYEQPTGWPGPKVVSDMPTNHGRVRGLDGVQDDGKRIFAGID